MAFQVEFTAIVIAMLLAVNSTWRGFGWSGCSHSTRRLFGEAGWVVGGCGDDTPPASSIYILSIFIQKMSEDLL